MTKTNAKKASQLCYAIERLYLELIKAQMKYHSVIRDLITELDFIENSDPAAIPDVSAGDGHFWIAGITPVYGNCVGQSHSLSSGFRDIRTIWLANTRDYSIEASTDS